MTIRKFLTTLAVMTVVISIPFTILHLIASPDEAPITPLQHTVAAVANFFGPWGAVLVRLVHFPNAGLRSFSWLLAIGLTLIGALLLGTARWTAGKWMQIVLIACWALFSTIWFSVGFLQIADGLL